MNLYFILSEKLKERDRDNVPGEYYKICEFVVSKKSSQAKYKAWKTDKESFTGDMCDMPKMKCELVEKNTALPEGIVTKTHETECWKKYAKIGYRQLIDKITEETCFLSYPTTSENNENYKELLDMGKAIIPFIIEDMKNNKSNWIHITALVELEQKEYDKIFKLPEHSGIFSKLTEDAINWWNNNNQFENWEE